MVKHSLVTAARDSSAILGIGMWQDSGRPIEVDSFPKFSDFLRYLRPHTLTSAPSRTFIVSVLDLSQSLNQTTDSHYDYMLV